MKPHFHETCGCFDVAGERLRPKPGETVHYPTAGQHCKATRAGCLRMISTEIVVDSARQSGVAPSANKTFDEREAIA
jgi:hypothetical protein